MKIVYPEGKKPYGRLSPQQKIDAITDYMKGESWQMICSRYLISDAAVRLHLKKNSVKANRYIVFSPTEEQKADIIAAYARRRTASQIGAKYNVCCGTILKFLKRNNVEIRGRSCK